MSTDSAREYAQDLATTLAQWPNGCSCGDDAYATCGECGASWCAECDPSPSMQCHTCNGRGYSDTARVDIYEWMEGALNIRRTFDATGDLIGVSLLLAYGGPTAWAHFTDKGADVAASWYCDAVHVWSDCEALASAVLEACDTWTVNR